MSVINGRHSSVPCVPVAAGWKSRDFTFYYVRRRFYLFIIKANDIVAPTAACSVLLRRRGRITHRVQINNNARRDNFTTLSNIICIVKKRPDESSRLPLVFLLFLRGSARGTVFENIALLLCDDFMSHSHYTPLETRV